MEKHLLRILLITLLWTLAGNSCFGIESLYGTWEGTWYPEKVVDFDGPLVPPYDPIPVRMTIHQFDEAFDSYGHIAPLGSIYSARLTGAELLAGYEFEIGSDIRGLATLEAELIDENTLVDEDFDGHGMDTTGPPGYEVSSGGRLVLIRTIPEPSLGPGCLIIPIAALAGLRSRHGHAKAAETTAARN